MNTFLERILGVRSDFERIFFKNEYKALAGKNRRTILALLTILFLTFLALGFAVGSLGNLEKKMNNPFTNWVNLNIYSDYISEKSGDIMSRYDSATVAEQFQIANSNGFSRYLLEFYEKNFSPFYQKSDTLVREFWGRTIEAEEPLLQRILDPTTKNPIWVATDLYDEDNTLKWDNCSVVVTEKLLHMLGYKNPDSVGYIGLREERIVSNKDTTGMWLPMKVVAVVRELPDVDFISSPQLYNALKNKGNRCREELLTENQEDNQVFVLLQDKGDLDKFTTIANKYFLSKEPGIDVEYEFPSGSQNWIGCHLSFLPLDAPSLDTLQQFVQFAGKSGVPIAEFSFMNCTKSTCNDVDPRELMYLAFHFDRLDAIRTFQEDMDETFGIQIDMHQIESKENFALVSRLTFAISIILLAFGVLSIVLFVNNLLRTHLYEVRSNLGTFQAFGLNNKFLIDIYLKIILSFLAVAIVIAIAITLLVDVIEYYWVREESKFDITNGWIVCAVVGLIGVSLILSSRTIQRILGNTPGNLIYER